MSILAPPPPSAVKNKSNRMTVDEFLDLPDDPTIERELIRGELKVRAMTVRGKSHARTEGRIVQRLNNFCDDANVPFEAVSGEAGVILDEERSGVGVDVVCCSTDLLSTRDESTRLIRGVPLIAVEVLSESDKVGDVADKVDLYLDAGVKLVWVADPRQKSVAAHVAGRPVRVYSGEDVIDAEPALEGFAIPVRKLFER